MKLIARLLLPIGLLATIQCGQSNSPAAPSSSVSLSLSLGNTTVLAGATTQGTVALNTPASTAITIALSSSNPSIATVPATVSISSGASSAVFTVTAMAAGTTSLAASLNGASSQAVTLTVGTRTVALATLSLADATLTEGASSGGTVTLTAPAPAGGASVDLSGGVGLIMPAMAIVNAGATSATFTFATKTGTGVTSSTITASYGGTSMSASLTIAKPTIAIARFGVTGPHETETCEMANNGQTLACTFNASTSSAPGTIVSYEWTYSVAGKFSSTMTTAVLTNPAVDCSLLPPPPLPMGMSGLTLTVTLRIRDDRGNTADASDPGARLLPMHMCGY